jgi:hypothetical protein
MCYLSVVLLYYCHRDEAQLQINIYTICRVLESYIQKCNSYRNPNICQLININLCMVRMLNTHCGSYHNLK